MVFTTGHDLKGNSLPDWAKLAISGATVAVYMGRSVAADVAGRLIEAGLSPDTAVAVVENASLPNRRRFHGTLADLPSLEARADLTGPVMTIIGDAVAGANFERSEPLAAHRHESACRRGRRGSRTMKILTANRLTDGIAVWYADGGWAETIDHAELAHDKAAEDRLEAIGAKAYADNEVVDVNLIDVDVVDGVVEPVRLREKIRAAGPTIRSDLGKQAASGRRSQDTSETGGRALKDEACTVTMSSTTILSRPASPSSATRSSAGCAGEITEDQFRPLRLMNGVYLQLHAYMLRIAVPYGTLNGKQLRMLGHIARKYDKGYGHFTTRQNIQFNWPALSDIPAILADLASVEMHAIQTSGNCIRNVTADHFAGAAADEVADPRPYAEILRQWSSVHPEFSFLPRKFKIAVTGAERDRAAIQTHDIGLHLKKNAAGELGFAVYVGGGQGRTPMVAKKIRDFLPEADLLSYCTAILRVYNLYGRRDNKYKARIKILVHETGVEEITRQVEAEWQELKDAELKLPEADIRAIEAYFAPPALADAAGRRRGGQAGAARFQELLGMARPERRDASPSRLCGGDDLAEGHRRGAGRRHRQPDGSGRRHRREIRLRRAARQP